MRSLILKFLNSLNKDRARFIHWWPVWMGSGIYFYFKLSYEPSLKSTSAIGGSVAVTVFFIWYFSRQKNSYYQYPWPFFFSIPIFIILGFLCAQFNTFFQQKTPLLTIGQKNITLESIILNIEHASYNNKGHLTLKHPLYGAVRVTIKKEFLTSLDIGDHVICRLNLLPLNLPLMPFAYDPSRTHYFSGIRATGSLLEPCQVVSKRTLTTLDSIRFKITTALRYFLPNQKGEIAAALVTGDRSGILNNIRQEFADAGLAHVLAISGLHVSIVAGIFFLLFWRILTIFPALSLRYHLRKWAAALSIPATLGYAAIAGFGYPVLRSLGMTTLILTAILIDKRAISMRALSLAALGILIFFPHALLSPSFQMSFAAVTALIGFYEWLYLPMQNIFSRYSIPTILIYFLGIVLSTLIATIATTAFSVTFFNRLTLQALIGNMVAIPLTSFFIMPMAVVSTISLCWGGSFFLFDIWGRTIGWLMDIASFTAALPGAGILVPTPPTLFLPIFSLGGLWFCLWRERHRFIGLIIAALSPLLFFYAYPPDIYIGQKPFLIAVRTFDKLYVSRKTPLYNIQQYQKENGIHDNNVILWPKDIMVFNGVLITTAHTIDTSLCEANNLIIAPQKLCTYKPYIHLKSQNSFIWLKEKKSKTINEYLGNRPWYTFYKK